MYDYIKTKCMSLGAEAKLIRQYERARFRKANKFLKLEKDRSAAYNLRVANGLRQHRIFVVQPEARMANIAAGFLRGRKYYQIEKSAYTSPNWKRIETLVLTFAERDNPKYNQTVEERFKTWKNEAIYYYETSTPGLGKVSNNVKLEVDVVGNNQIGYMENGSEYQLSLKAKRRAAYVPDTVCLNSEQGI